MGPSQVQGETPSSIPNCMKSSAIKLEKGNWTAPKTMVTNIAHLTGERSAHFGLLEFTGTLI